MKIVKLTNTHASEIKHLFKKPKFMSVSASNNYFVSPDVEFSETYFKAFESSYLTGLTNYHAYGAKDDNGVFVGVLAFYESIDDASWYWNTIRTNGNNKDAIRLLLDAAITHNEIKGRYKFYSMFPKKYTKVYRRLAFSKDANERYDYFDEYFVPAKHQCLFTLPWQILYTRNLLPVDTIVRCTFLKQKYRSTVFNAGRL